MRPTARREMLRLTLFSLTCSFAGVPAGAIDWNDVEIVAIRAVPSHQLGADAPSSPNGDNQLSPTGAENICCIFEDPACSTAPGVYDVGDTVALNTYWNEVLPDPIPNPYIVDWTLGIKPNAPIILFQDEPIGFGAIPPEFQPGDELTFCVAGLLSLPPESAGLSGILQGHGVTAPTGTLPITAVNSFSVRGEPLEVNGSFPASGGLGTEVTFDGAGFPTNPDDICIRQASGASARATASNGTTVTADVLPVHPDFEPAPWSIVTGDGTTTLLPEDAIATAAFAWGFLGNGGPDTEVILDEDFVPEPEPPGPIITRFQVETLAGDDGNDILITRLEFDPCNDGSNRYPADSTILSDAHYNVSCPGSFTDHLDCFVDEFALRQPVDSATLADKIAERIQACFDNAGHGALVAVTGTAAGSVILEHRDPDCKITSGTGAVRIEPNC